MSAATSLSAAVANMRISSSNCFFLLCDVQERLCPLMYKMHHMLHSINLLISVSKEMQIPMIVTEQYPECLGKTLSSLDISEAKLFEKTKFSMLTDQVSVYLDALRNRENRRVAVLFGSEAHICVQQSALDLLEAGFRVHLVVDAVSSQRSLDRSVAIKKMEEAGVSSTTTESLLFELIRTKDHKSFKTISSLAKRPFPPPEDLFPPTC